MFLGTKTIYIFALSIKVINDLRTQWNLFDVVDSVILKFPADDL